MFGDTININDLCYNLAVLKKKLVKPFKNCFWTQFAQKKGHYGPRSKWGKTFVKNTKKSRSSAFRKFLFYQNIIYFDWVMNLFLSWAMFSVKKVPFPAKAAGGAIANS